MKDRCCDGALTDGVVPHASRRYRQRPLETGLRCSTSCAANPYDNAHAERSEQALEQVETNPRGYRTMVVVFTHLSQFVKSNQKPPAALCTALRSRNTVEA